MARFDVFTNPFAPERNETPYVLDVQNDHLGPLGTRVVIPLRNPKGFGKPAGGLNLVLEVENRPVVLDTAALAPVGANLLTRPVAHLGPLRNQVLDAIDTLFGAY